MGSTALETRRDRVGVFHYLAPSVESSLYRNGKVRIRRSADGNDDEAVGIDRERYEAPVLDGRELLGDLHPTLFANGFELRTHPLARPELDFLDHREVVTGYYRECERIVEEATGARAFAFDHNVRSARSKNSRKRIAGGQEVQAPIHVVHGDYTLTSGPQRLRDLAKLPSRNDTLRTVLGPGESLLTGEAVARALGTGGRFAFVNVWRNIAEEPVATHPLALCDARTVEPMDLVVLELHYEDRVGENYLAKHSDHHRWVFHPAMTRDEVVLIKQWDSAGPLARSEGGAGDASEAAAACTFSFHTAFHDPATPPDAPDRRSIEVRCAVLYP